jgi:PqqD family protein of HPr-rel-A system
MRSEFEGQHIVYHRPSGKTHFLNPSAGTLLELICERPMDVAALANVLSEQYPDLLELRQLPNSDDAAFQDGLVRYLAGVLLRFEEVGLVTRERF